MGTNGSATLERFNISSISVSRSTGEQMNAKMAEGATVAIWLPRSLSQHHVLLPYEQPQGKFLAT